MATLITYEYFTGQINISNVDPNVTTEEGNYSQLVAFIEDYEPELMSKVIGKQLYDALIVGLSAPVVEARWTALAAKLRDTTSKKSPIANYIYVNLWDVNQRQTTQSGDVVMTGTGIIPDANIAKIDRIWNQMVDQLIIFQEWFFENQSDYAEYDGSAYIYSVDDKMYSNLGI